MSASAGCKEVQGLAPELALRIATGDERARALDHLADCPDCRNTVAELSDIADEVLLLAPVREPPHGFDKRVLDHLGPRRRARRRFGLLAAAAAVVLAAAVTAAGMHLASTDTRELATHYRQTLGKGNGHYFGAVALRKHSGKLLGHVYAYRGSPSWLFVSVSSGDETEPYGVEMVTANGRRVRLGSFRIVEGKGGWGKAIPGHLQQVAEVRLLERPDEEGAGSSRSFTELDAVADLRDLDPRRHVGP